MMTNEQPSKPEKPFQFKLWAVLIGLGSVQTLFMFFFPVPNVPPFTPLQKVIQVSTALVGIAAAIGFWLQRRWGLWLYIALLVFFYAQVAVTMVNERIATGTLTFPMIRVGTLIVGTFFLIFFYSQRHQFK